MASKVLWTTFTAPKTLFNVGSEALCMLCDNILCFTDLKTNAISYYKAESPEMGLSIQAATGHQKFSLVAFCELVLRPSVHIIEYPTFNKYTVFRTANIITFVDIRFNDFDLLVALSGFPHYTFCIWNFRTGQQLLQHDTLKESLARSILCSYNHTPQIVQFSEWHREILVWELCYTSTGVDLHEVSKIQLSKDFTFSNISIMCYGEDNTLYVVDNFANVFWVEVAHFHLRSVWSASDSPEVCATLKRFGIESHKQGLLVYSPEIIYYLRRKLNKWQCEWKLLAGQLPQNLCKCISNVNGELYASAAVGNLYHIETSANEIEVIPVNAHQNENCIDVVLLKGIKEECLIQLTVTNFVNALAMSHLMLYSRIEIPQSTCVVAHNAIPCILVGTSTGHIYLIDYRNIRKPSIVASIQNEKHFAVQSLLFFDCKAVYRTIYNDFRLLVADISQNSFYELVTFERFTAEVGVIEFFLAENHIFLFFHRDSPILMPHANLMCCYQFYAGKRVYDRLEFNLPHTYRDVATLTAATKNAVEFFAVRLETNIMDYLNFRTNTNELVILYSVETRHLSYIHGIQGATNLLTWGSDGTLIHYRLHRKSTKAYGVSQILQIKYRPRVVKKVMECFMAKYLVYLYSRGGIKVIRVPSTSTATVDNTFINETPLTVEPSSITVHAIVPRKSMLDTEHSPKELQAKKTLLQKVRSLKQKVSDLIDYDISVTGKSQGVFKKFCLNRKWLNKLNEEARKLFDAERQSVEAAIKDQSRIRDWICVFVTGTNMGITYQIRAIFSHFSVTNFGLRRTNFLSELFDLYRFYELECVENEDEEAEETESSGLQEGDEKQVLGPKEGINFFKVRGSTYDHVMCDEFAMQDVNVVTGNQMINQDAKVRALLIDRLKVDFNKMFEEVKQTKHELMAAICNTNGDLKKIYDNINCMLKLLGRDEFEPPQLAIPEWHKDEFVESIMEVDDAEIKAVNRNKKKEVVELEKRGRLLLWSVEFWQRALNEMMDGVLEKLWEEEIKKEIPQPEFLIKKDVAEYTLEDQKALKEYEEKCRLLMEDRQKYLKILNDSEAKTNSLKTSYILKLNENVTQLMISKLKYDFAINHVRLRNFNTKVMYFKKLQWLERINMLRYDIDLFTEYIEKYGRLYEFWSRSVDDFRQKVESLTLKQKTIERQYRGQFLNSIPQHLGPEMNKTFKKRPKTSPKLLNSALICKEIAMRVNSKSKPKFPFPLPKDVFEYLEGLSALDNVSNIPVSLETKSWDQFVKLRRQRVEVELKLRAVNLQLADFVSDTNLYGKELGNLKNAKIDATQLLQEAQAEYLKSIQNQALEIRLTMGQVEFNIMGSLKNLDNCVLIHKDDINDINALILNAGQRKIKAMQKVAFFRRQVIYREWEHKMVSANIEYLNNMLYVIGKCKVSVEFLNILRNWNKIKMKKEELINTEGLLEKVAEEKLTGYRKELTRMNEKISKTRQQIDETKQINKRINRQIDELKSSVAFSQANRDYLIEEKRKREQDERMEQIKRHSNLIEAVRRDYVHIMELKTILELQRLRTYPTLGPNPNQCLK